MSEEQLKIIDSISSDNVVVNSVAGSGKTTTALLIAETYIDDTILLLTYNARLKEETRAKRNAKSLDNIEVHSFNSFGVQYISSDCKDDIGLTRCLTALDERLHNKYEIIIIDELQDMTMLFYNLVKHVMAANPKARLCLIGDSRQCIYGYRSATPKFLEHAPQLFQNGRNWVTLQLSKSFRITEEIAEFINRGLYGHQVISANKHGALPRYCQFNIFSPKNFAKELEHYLVKYKLDDIFILSQSVKTKNTSSPLYKIINYISDVMNIPIYNTHDNDLPMNDDVIKGKLVFSSIHKVKGLERKVVILLGFDAFTSSFNTPQCPNTVYVALTRASEQISIIHNVKESYLPFLQVDKFSEICYSPFQLTPWKTKQKKSKIHNMSVTDCCKHLPPTLVHKCMELLEIEQSPPLNNIGLKSITNQKHGLEEIADLNGIAIQMYCEWRLCGYSTVCKKLSEFYDSVNFSEDPKELLRIANIWHSHINKTTYRVNQITNYDWLSENHLEAAYKNFSLLKLDEVNVEVEMKTKYLSGSADMVCGNEVYEIKCVSSIREEHIIQLALYMFMHDIELKVDAEVTYNGKKAIVKKVKDIATILCNGRILEVSQDNVVVTQTGKLINVATGEILKITSTEDQLRDLYKELISCRVLRNEYDMDSEVDNLISTMEIKKEDEKKQSNMILECEDFKTHTIKEDPIIDVSQLTMVVSVKENSIIDNQLTMIIDTETTGFAKYDRIIEVGYLLYDGNDIVKRYQKFINPTTYPTYKVRATEIHGITYNMACEGATLDLVMEEFYRDLLLCDTLVAHNAAFDKRMLIQDAQRIKRDDIIAAINATTVFCTQKHGASQFPGSSNRGRIKLVNLYKAIFEEDPIQQHRAIGDCLMTLDCYCQLV